MVDWQHVILRGARNHRLGHDSVCVFVCVFGWVMADKHHHFLSTRLTVMVFEHRWFQELMSTVHAMMLWRAWPILRSDLQCKIMESNAAVIYLATSLISLQSYFKTFQVCSFVYWVSFVFCMFVWLSYLHDSTLGGKKSWYWRKYFKFFNNNLISSLEVPSCLLRRNKGKACHSFVFDYKGLKVKNTRENLKLHFCVTKQESGGFFFF